MADVLVHIDERLSLESLADLQRDVSMGDGIRSACVSDTAHHMMIVDFDEQRMNTSDVLHRVEDNGLHAELVGF